MAEQITGSQIRLDCRVPQLDCPTVFSTLLDKAETSPDPTCKVLQTTGQEIRTDNGEVLSSAPNSNSLAPSRPCASASRPSILSTTGRSVLFLAVLATSLVAWAGDAKPGNDPVQAMLDRIKKMSPAEQQAWLAQLEQRAARAARLTLSPEEAARQQAHTQSLLHQKTVTWQLLREVIDDTEAREKATKAAEVAKPHAVKTAQIAKTQATENAKPQAVEQKNAKPQAANKTVAKPQAVEVAKPHAVKRATDVDVAPTDKLPPGSVTVNVEELEARIGGCNLALRELETELAEKDVVWSAAKLEPLSDRLKVLVLRHDDLGLVRGAVPKEQRSDVASLESPRSAISQLSARVVEARNRANDPKFAGDDVERQAELTRLQAISHRMAELDGK